MTKQPNTPPGRPTQIAPSTNIGSARHRKADICPLYPGGWLHRARVRLPSGDCCSGDSESCTPSVWPQISRVAGAERQLGVTGPHAARTGKGVTGAAAATRPAGTRQHGHAPSVREDQGDSWTERALLEIFPTKPGTVSVALLARRKPEFRDFFYWYYWLERGPNTGTFSSVVYIIHHPKPMILPEKFWHH